MQLITYTRAPGDDRVYAKRLAYSMHIALFDGERVLTLNHNSGVLFAKATENPDGSLNAKSLRHPYPFRIDDKTYGILCTRIEADGDEDTEERGKVLYYETDNFIEFKSGLNIPEKKMAEYRAFLKDAAEMTKRVNTLSTKVDFEIRTPVIIDISDELGDYLKKKLTPVENVSVDIPGEISVKKREDLDKIRVRCLYSDGTELMRRVLWDEESLKAVDFDKEGTYELKGRIYQPHFKFPLIENRADPCLTVWNDRYYFVSTHDADHEHTMYVRTADILEGIETAEDHLILDAYTYEDIGGLLWAPEFHEIDGRLYIFHAATPGPFFFEESHVMVLKEGGDPCNREDWSRPERVTKADGSELARAGETITLDMTEFEWEGELYAAWSQRQFLPKDLGAWLYFAKLDRKCPWKLASEPVVLSKPDYGWANNHTFVDEGPFALIRGDKLYLTFSSAAVDSTYVVGMLTLNKGDDPLDPANWKKRGFPLFTSRSVEGEYGTGHNAYLIDKDGIVWNSYHARPGLDGPRSTGIRRVHFDIDGEPMLDVTEELDLKEEFKTISVRLKVE